MSDSLLRVLAKKAEGSSFFLASVLAPYADGEHLDDAGLAEKLGCRMEDLTMLRLCRAPRREASLFWNDVRSIAEHFDIDPYRLANIVKGGRVLVNLRETTAATAESGFLMAARDREEEER
jgi:hypothetical protein